MDFKKPQGNEEQLIEMYAPERSDVARRKMFGYPACFVNGRMFMGTYNGQLLFKLAASDVEEFKKKIRRRRLCTYARAQDDWIRFSSRRVNR